MRTCAAAFRRCSERAGGTIRIATFKSVAVNWLLPPMIKQFQVQHPEARFRLFDGAYAEVDAYVRSGTVAGFISLPSELLGDDRACVQRPAVGRAAGGAPAGGTGTPCPSRPSARSRS